MSLLLLLVLYAFPLLSLIIGLVGLYRNPSNWRRYLPMCINFVFMGAYAYTPDPSSNEDLIRYFPQIEYIALLPFEEALTYGGRGLIAQNLFFWIFGSLHMIHMVPAISTATVYSIAGYITCDTAERYNAKKYIFIVFLLQLVILPYHSIICNVRNVFGLSIVLLAVYLDLAKGKRSLFVWFCYIFGTLMHLSVAILIVFRIVCILGEKYFEEFVLGQALFATIVFNIYELRSLFSFGGALGNAIQTAIRKLNFYLTSTTHVGAVKYLRQSIFSTRTLMVIGAVLAVLIVWYVIRSKSTFFYDSKSLYVFVSFIAMTTISFHFFMMIPNYWRFAATLYVAIGILFIPLLRNYGRFSFIPKLLLVASILIGPAMLLFQIRLSLGLTNLTGWMFGTLTSNYILVLFDFIKGMASI